MPVKWGLSVKLGVIFKVRVTFKVTLTLKITPNLKYLNEIGLEYRLNEFERISNRFDVFIFSIEKTLYNTANLKQGHITIILKIHAQIRCAVLRLAFHQRYWACPCLSNSRIPDRC